jgi:hypothetical protein
MQSSGWIALLHQLPKDQHDNLIFTTSAGVEIAVNAVHRIEADYVLLRGRQTGAATESGGFYFLPYDRILFMGFQKPVKEITIRAIYGEAVSAVPTRQESPERSPEPAQVSETAAPPVEPEPPSPTAATPEPAPPAPEPSKPNPANKAALLERLRARRNDPAQSFSRP